MVERASLRFLFEVLFLLFHASFGGVACGQLRAADRRWQALVHMRTRQPPSDLTSQAQPTLSS